LSHTKPIANFDELVSSLLQNIHSLLVVVLHEKNIAQHLQALSRTTPTADFDELVLNLLQNIHSLLVVVLHEKNIAQAS